MTKSTKLLPILCGVLAVLIAATVWVISYNPEEEVNPATQAVKFLQYDNVDDIVILDVDNETGHFTLANGGEGKGMVKDVEDDLVSQDKIRAFFQQCQLIYATGTVVEGVAEADLAQYGLAEPSATVTMMDSKESGMQFKLGKLSPDGKNYYMYVTGLDKVYLMDGEMAERFFQSKDNFLQLLFYPSMKDANIKDIASIQVTDANGTGYTLKRTRVSDMTNLIYFDMVAPVYITTGRENVDDKLLIPLENLEGDAMVYDAFSQGELTQDVLAEYGLAEPRYTLQLDYKNQDFTILFGNSENGYTYATDGSGKIYTVADDQVEFLSLTYMDIIGSSVYKRNITTISNISLDIRGTKYSFDVEGSGNLLTITVGGEKLSTSEFMELFTGLNAISIEGEVEEASVSGKPIFSMEVTYREGDPNETIRLIPIDDRKCAIEVNGHVAFATYTTVVDKIANLAELSVAAKQEG